MTLQPAGWRAATRGAAARRGMGLGWGGRALLRPRRPGARPRVPPASCGAGGGGQPEPAPSYRPACGRSQRPALPELLSPLFGAGSQPRRVPGQRRDGASSPCRATRRLRHPGCPPQTPRSRAKPSLRFLLHKTHLLPDSFFPPFLGKAVFLTASLLALLGPEGSACSVLGTVGGGRHPRRGGLLVLVWYPNHVPMVSELEDPVLTKRTWLPGDPSSQLRFVKSHTKAQLKFSRESCSPPPLSVRPVLVQ